MGLSNDERGWVMTCLSGIACVVGASIICVDIIIRQFPGKQDFRIQDSDTFLSVSLSLSFGVMLFSALYSMLPSSKKSLIDGGFSPKAASWILIACFIGGVLGIQIISRILHHYIPSHVVDCEHSHDETDDKENGHAHEHDHDHGEDVERHQPRPQLPSRSSLPGHMLTPGGGRKRSNVQTSYFGSASGQYAAQSSTEESVLSTIQTQPSSAPRRPSLQARVSTTINQLATGFKPSCDCNGPCYGYSDPCGKECFKKINGRGGFRAPLTSRASNGSMKPGLSRNATVTGNTTINESTPLLEGITEEESRPISEDINEPPTRYFTTRESQRDSEDSSNTTVDNANTNGTLNKTHTNTSTASSGSPDNRHHHHVPTNAFLSIGLQTSIAIALHKLPEGFITYATNHANPSLGFAVFLALFIHNITEGFAMALPLYLAINSRWKAMVISFVLGGLSQPIGAAVAAVWFKLAGNGEWAPSEGVYGAMFAVTAGIMASVALQLFSESLDLTHSRGLCMVGAFVGMGILGVSSALTA